MLANEAVIEKGFPASPPTLVVGLQQIERRFDLNGPLNIVFPSLVVLINRAVPISWSLALGPHPFASTVNAMIGRWPSCSTVSNSLALPSELNAYQGNSMSNFSSLWYRASTFLSSSSMNNTMFFKFL